MARPCRVSSVSKERQAEARQAVLVLHDEQADASIGKQRKQLGPSIIDA